MDEHKKTPSSDIKAHIESADPLSEQAITIVLDHNEEDVLVDYKESFDSKNEKCWIDIDIDAAAFANTHGGYIVFGVQDKTYKKLGVSNVECAVLCDIKVIRVFA